eukprot:1143558-Pelagomonas_calceolata.AAC.2
MDRQRQKLPLEAEFEKRLEADLQTVANTLLGTMPKADSAQSSPFFVCCGELLERHLVSQAVIEAHSLLTCLGPPVTNACPPERLENEVEDCKAYAMCVTFSVSVAASTRTSLLSMPSSFSSPSKTALVCYRALLDHVFGDNPLGDFVCVLMGLVSRKDFHSSWTRREDMSMMRAAVLMPA